MNYWIVVVDDEVLNLTNAKQILNEHNMRVSCLRSGRDLLKFMAKNEPDLILLDILMPEIDGFETYQALRRLEDEKGKKQTPVIFLTGSEDREIERRGLKAGASDFIRKPFNREILTQRIQNTLSSVKTIENLTEEVAVDKLTGLLNKAAGTERIAKLCETKTGALVVFDLDNFKLVNDLFGHDMGDRVLKAFSEVARRSMRTEDVMARIGGDEFMAFCFYMSDEMSVKALTRRLSEQFLFETTRLMGEESNVPLGLSAGVVMVPEHGRAYETLFSLADSTLYQAKKNGKHGCSVYHSEAATEISHEEDIGNELARVMKIVGERNESGGALFLGLDHFSSVYRFVDRFGKRYGGRNAKLMFALSEKEDDEAGGQTLKDAAEQFGLCLQDTLSRSDIILQSKPNQFFLLLPELTEEDFPDLLQRIMKAWEATGHHDKIIVDHSVRFAVYEKPPFERTKTP